MPIDPKLIRSVFERSLDIFFTNEATEVVEGVNERSSCGRLAIYMERIAHESGLIGYFADTEYNRKQNGEVKTILDHDMKIIAINCDLILHSRGQIIKEDNLIAVEMKKHDRPKKERVDDCNRLRALTKSSFDDVWSNDGITLPEHVCGYALGAFIELDRKQRLCRVEYFARGEKSEEFARAF